jgi:phosphatidate phosphatase APP1
MSRQNTADTGMRADRQGWDSSDESGREWGSRRKKVFGYLKAANELRQTYASQLSQKIQNAYDDRAVDAPGAFPDVEIARSGDEEMVLFPSYARRHVKKKKQRPPPTQNQPMPGTDEDLDRPRSPGNMEYWKDEWEKYEDDNALVDVDIRGWLYTPQRGPMNRKHRLLISLARRLSGIPAPAAPPNDSITQQHANRREEEDVTREAQSIITKAEQDADTAWKSSHDTPDDSQAVSMMARQSADGSLSKNQLTIANAHLMERLRPFMSNPMIGTPVTMFFFNDRESQSRTTMTNDAGHFTMRAALEFVPTHVRVLASEQLSATEEIQVIEPTGVSLISDVDDTIKHSAITSSAKEIFRNTFVRELNELTIVGVKDWYNKMADMGVQMHYVSNAPWQLYPLLKSYFKLAGLPPGSFHLKQYSGMLQGIFEPTAERKRGSLEKIMRDFPERKFILVGDSGEADLEVYTDLALENPGRILGVFIRDITTSEKKDFFDKSFDSTRTRPAYSRTRSYSKDHTDAMHNRPTLPPRRHPDKAGEAKTLDNGDLIDLESLSSEEEKPYMPVKKAPMKPAKPSTLRSNVMDQNQSRDDAEAFAKPEAIRRKPAPPLQSEPQPRRPSSAFNQSEDREQSPALPRRAAQLKQPPAKPTRPSPAQRESQDESYSSAVKNIVSSAYNSLPSTREYLPSIGSSDSLSGAEARSKRPPPVPPPRRSGTPSTATQKSGNFSPQPPSRQTTSSSFTSNSRSNTTDYDSGLAYYDPTDGQPVPQLNKREELWRRRWERAQQILSEHNVVLGSWRVGTDVQDITAWLVEEAQKKGRQPKGE